MRSRLNPKEVQHEKYIGVDLGKRKAVVVKKDRRGKITEKATLAATEAALAKYFSKQDSRSENSYSGQSAFLETTPQIVL